MEDNMEESKQIIAKQEAFKTTIKSLEGAVGRVLDETERLAVGFVFDRRWDGDAAPEAFSHKLGLAEEKGNDATWKIRTAVDEESVEEIKRRIGGNIQNLEEVARLQAIRTFIETGRNEAQQVRQSNPSSQVHIGGVPDYWLPVWLHK